MKKRLRRCKGNRFDSVQSKFLDSLCVGFIGVNIYTAEARPIKAVIIRHDRHTIYYAKLNQPKHQILILKSAVSMIRQMEPAELEKNQRMLEKRRLKRDRRR